MTKVAHWLSLMSAVVHIAIGLPEVLGIGPRFLPASWVVIYAWLPDHLWWLWPGLYVATGIASMLGVRNTKMLRLGFRMSAAIHFVWGSVSLFAWSTNQGGTLPGSFTYWFLAGVLAVLAPYVGVGERAEHTDQIADRIQEQVSVGAAQVFEAEDVRKANGASDHG